MICVCCSSSASPANRSVCRGSPQGKRLQPQQLRGQHGAALVTHTPTAMARLAYSLHCSWWLTTNLLCVLPVRLLVCSSASVWSGPTSTRPARVQLLSWALKPWQRHR